MAIRAHADDIKFNAASTLLKYYEKGYEVIYVQSTNNMSGTWSHLLPDGTKEVRIVAWSELMPQRKLECEKAAKELFNTVPIHLNHPQRHYRDEKLAEIELRYGAPCPGCVLPDTPTIITAHEHKPSVEKLASLILEKNPEAILTHAPVDSNPEHSCTNLLVNKAYQAARKKGYGGTLLFWLQLTSETFGETFNLWNTFINTDGYFQQKFQAIGIHACQVPKPETLDLEDKLRGKICGCKSAEVFNICHIGESNQGEFTQEIIRNTCHFQYGK